MLGFRKACVYALRLFVVSVVYPVLVLIDIQDTPDITLSGMLSRLENE